MRDPAQNVFGCAMKLNFLLVLVVQGPPVLVRGDALNSGLQIGFNYVTVLFISLLKRSRASSFFIVPRRVIDTRLRRASTGMVVHKEGSQLKIILH